MTAYVTTAAGRTFQLPVPLSWELNYTAGVPSDSFWVRCPWQAGQGTDPAEWVRFSAAEAGETVFSGVVDECEVNQGAEGLRLEVSGRGMAALLLDNEALGQDYGNRHPGRHPARPCGPLWDRIGGRGQPASGEPLLGAHWEQRVGGAL